MKEPSEPTVQIRFAKATAAVRLVLANDNAAETVSVARLRRMVLRRAKFPVFARAPVFALDSSSAPDAWELGTEGTRCGVEDGYLVLTSDHSTTGYQLLSPVIEIDPGSPYVAEIDIELDVGGMSFGVLDVEADTWIDSVALRADGSGPLAYPWSYRDDDTRELVPCPFPWSAAMVYPDGHVQTCCFNSRDLGNVNEESFAAIWNGAAYQELRQRLSRGDYDRAGCAECPMYSRAGYTTQMAVDSKLRPAAGTEMQLTNARLAHAEYRAGADVMEAAPTSLALELSQACNYDCTFCFQEDKLLGIKGERIRTLVDGMLPKAKELVMTGGEPFAFKENIRILEAITPAQRSNVDLEFYTNAALLHRHFDLLRTFSSVNVVVSLHSLVEPVYRRIMVADTSLDDVIANIDRCLEIGRDQPNWRMVITNILMRSNVHEVEDLSRFAVDRGIDLQFAHMHGDYEENVYLYPWLLDDVPGAVAKIDSSIHLLSQSGALYDRAVENLTFIRRKLTAPPLPTLPGYEGWIAEKGRVWALNRCQEMFAER